VGRRVLPRLGRDVVPLPQAGFLHPGWALRPRPSRPASSSPGWAGSWLTPAGPMLAARLGSPGHSRPGGPLPVQHPAGPDYENPAWPGFPLQAPFVRPGWAGLECPDWARPAPPGPGRIISLVGRNIHSPGRINSIQAELYLFWPRFTFSGTFPSSSIDSSALCQSWDASRLGLAHPPSLYAGLGKPLWLRPAYYSPSQSYPQEKDKTDDMEILKTDARRRRPSTDIDGTSP
jgi:hypothetical protein